MKLHRSLFAFIACTFTATACAQVPQLLNYQGRVVVGTTNFDGTGQFKFALVNNNGSVTFWSNDGTSSGGSQPAAAVSLSVVRGLYAVLLGDTTLAGMSSALPATVFTNSDVRLRVWFNDGALGFQQFTPDQRLAAVGYALMGANVPDGVITSNKLADGAVTATKLASNSVTALHLASNAVTGLDITNHLALGHATLSGSLSVFRNDSAVPSVVADGAASEVRVTRTGTLHAQLSGGSTGDLRLYDLGGQNTVWLGSDIVNGGFLNVNHSNGSPRVRLNADQFTGTLDLYSTNNSLRARLANDASSSSLNLYTINGMNRVSLNADTLGSYLTLFASDGSSGMFLDGDSGGAGLLQIRNTNGNTRIGLIGQTTTGGGEVAVYDANGSKTAQMLGADTAGTGASLTLRNASGVSNVVLRAENSAGFGPDLRLFANGSLRAELDAADDGVFTLFQVDGSTGIYLDADAGGGGLLSLRNTNNSTRVQLDGYSTGGGGEISVFDSDGDETIEILGAESSGAGGQILMKNAEGTTTIQLDSDASGVKCGYLALNDSNGVARIICDADGSGDGRVTTQVLAITGGSDLSENFDIKSYHQPLAPGMIVCIDPKAPGQLVTSTRAYDKKVAGVISGAGGVRPGMLMGQRGSAADGAHPVALTGRVYCMVDADQGAIEPGDLITTSDTPGHGMKVADHLKAQGAIVGKAMTALAKGQGLVLVLVSLQ